MSETARQLVLKRIIRSAVKNEAWADASIAIRELKRGWPHVIVRMMYVAVKSGDIATYQALTKEGAAPEMMEIEWAAGGGKAGRRTIMEDVINNFPSLNFAQRGCLSLIFYSKIASVSSWEKLFALCKEKKGFEGKKKSPAKILESCLLYAMRKDNSELVEHLLDNVLPDYVNVKDLLKAPSISKAAVKCKAYNSLPYLLNHGLPIDQLNFNAFLKKSHKNDRYIKLIEKSDVNVVSDVMYEASRNNKAALLIKMIDEYKIRPPAVYTEKNKAIMNTYFQEKGVTPMEFLGQCGDDSELKALTLLALGQ